MKIIKTKDKAVIIAAFFTAAVVAGLGFIHDLDHREPLLDSIIKAFIVVICFFAFIVLAYISGGRKLNKGDLVVSPWFAVFVCGSFFLFWMGGIYANNLFFGCMAAVAMWGGLLLCIWSIRRLIYKKNSKMVAKGDHGQSSYRP